MLGKLIVLVSILVWGKVVPVLNYVPYHENNHCAELFMSSIRV
jgi:hypothetical protein